jgi:hypothetical protein
MAAEAAVQIEGMRETLAVLEELPRRIQRRAITKAVRAGGNPLLKAARRNAPRKTGIFRRSLTSVIRTYPRTGSVVMIVGQSGASKTNRLREKIRARGSHTGGISGRGDVVPSHFLEGDTRAHVITGARQKVRMVTTTAGGRRRARSVAVGEIQGMLSWTQGGQIFARQVRHPGTRGTRFLARSAAETQSEAREAFAAKLRIEVDAEAAAIAKAG